MSCAGISSFGKGVMSLAKAGRSPYVSWFPAKRSYLLEAAPPLGSESSTRRFWSFSSSAATPEPDGFVPAPDTVSLGPFAFGSVSTLIPLASASSTVIWNVSARPGVPQRSHRTDRLV